MSAQCTCRDSTDYCGYCARRIDDAQDNSWFFDRFDEGWSAPPGGELR